MGIGLALTRKIPLGNKNCYFFGEMIEVESIEHSTRVALGHTDYMIEVGKCVFCINGP